MHLRSLLACYIRKRTAENLGEGPGDQDAFIKPGSPWQNGYIESFHDKLRDECLNRELFCNLREARVILESWRVEYNERRPDSSLGYQTPSKYARKRTNRFDGGCVPQTENQNTKEPAEFQL